jgi:histone H3/H4
MSYTVASALKEKIAAADMMCAGDLPEALSAHVDGLLDKAIARAKANDRKTVRPEDL